METYAPFMDEPFILSYEEVALEEQPTLLMTQLRDDAVVSERTPHDIWRGGSDLREV